MTLDSYLLSILSCPKTQQPLKLADDTIVDRVNQSRQNSNDDPIQKALITQDNQLLYIVEGDIPILLSDKAIELKSII